MVGRSSVRYFRKTALCAFFAVAAGASISASAEKSEQVIIKNYSTSSGVQAFWIQSEANPGGWACFPVSQPTLLPNGRAIPGGANAPAILYNISYDFYALSSTSCEKGGQRITKLSTIKYKVIDPYVKTVNIDITDYGLNITQGK
ncbi:hypothetical protein [Xanthomonas albilineans]|uniref:Secreted protein n=1 Tax=Xanthomonas albilineans (strain GPE PC73 / CFBP 7063) TaxID=380358 RepID=D2UFW4_XANAP|nr:hypothetical protein [Xanthomonas albilineans]CBA17275.1 hypothetical protein XALC_2798 [Xanthomonas albilineans GPE PC73]